MVNKILEGAGFTKNATYKETRFIKPPNETYAIYNDSIARRGSDDRGFLTEHDVTIEIYEYTPDREAEKKLEDQLDLYHAFMDDSWSKQERYWLNEESLYQVIYEFSYIEKK